MKLPHVSRPRVDLCTAQHTRCRSINAGTFDSLDSSDYRALLCDLNTTLIHKLHIDSNLNPFTLIDCRTNQWTIWQWRSNWMCHRRWAATTKDFYTWMGKGLHSRNIRCRHIANLIDGCECYANQPTRSLFCALFHFAGSRACKFRCYAMKCRQYFFCICSLADPQAAIFESWNEGKKIVRWDRRDEMNFFSYFSILLSTWMWRGNEITTHAAMKSWKTTSTRKQNSQQLAIAELCEIFMHLRCSNCLQNIQVFGCDDLR